MPLSHLLSYQTERKKAILIYPGKGFMLNSPGSSFKVNGSGGKRGNIAGWSKSSRRRMREALLTLEAPAGWRSWGLSLTVAGEVVAPCEYRKMWHYFSVLIRRAGWAMIWRAEVQERGALHYHAVFFTPEMPPGDLEILIKSKWAAAIGKDRASLKGAAYRGACLEYEGKAGGAWRRYISDHASKQKQGQVGENIGRHWGVINRQFLTLGEPEIIDDLTHSQYYRVVRCEQRLATPRHRKRIKRGSYGKSVWFGREDTLNRIIEWARSLPEPEAKPKVYRPRKRKQEPEAPEVLAAISHFQDIQAAAVAPVRI